MSTNFMKKFKKPKIELEPLLLTLCVAKLLVLGAIWVEGIVIVSLVSLYGFNKYLKSKTPKSINNKVLEELEKVKGKVSSLVLHKSIKEPIKKHRW